MTSSVVLQKIRNYCVLQERSQQEVRDKLYDLGLHRNDVEETITQLITENFINEQRFAIAYAGGKFRIKGWGRMKIKQALANKRVSDACIRKALSELDDKDYQKTLKKIISEKQQTVKEKNPYKKNYAIARYAISRGFEPELVWSLLERPE